MYSKIKNDSISFNKTFQLITLLKYPTAELKLKLKEEIKLKLN